MPEEETSAQQKRPSTKETIALIAAGIAAIAAIASAIIAMQSAYVARDAAQSLQLNQQRLSAYSDFLNAQEKYWEAGFAGLDTEKGKRLDSEFQIESRSARKRIGIFGSEEVVARMAEFYRATDEDISESDRWKAQVPIYETMRREILGANEHVCEDDLMKAMFGIDPPNPK